MKRTWGAIFLGLVLVAACGSATPTSKQPVVENAGAGATVDVVAEPALPPLPPLPALSTEPVARPDKVMAVAVVPNMDALLNGVAAYADTVQPGLGAQLTVANLASELGPFADVVLAVDMTKPIRILAIEPDGSGLFDSVLVVVSVSANVDIDAIDRLLSNVSLRAQRRGNDLVIGTEAGMKAAADYAMTTLLTEPAPAHLTVTAWPQHAMTTFGPFLSAMASQAGAPQQVAATTSFLNFLSQLEVLKGEIVFAGQAGPSVNLTVIPEAGGSVAAFVAGQPASDFAILHDVTPGLAMFGGSLNFEPIIASLKAISGNLGSASADKMWSAIGNDFGGSISFDPTTGVSFTGSWSLKKPATSAKALFAMVSAAASSAESTVTSKSSTYKKTSIATLTITPVENPDPDALTAAPASSLSYALVDKRLVMSLSLADLKAHIDRSAAKKKPAVSAALQTAIDEARARRDSALILIDSAFISSMVGMPTQSPAPKLMALGIGASGNELRFHVELPLSFLSTLMALSVSSSPAPVVPPLVAP